MLGDPAVWDDSPSRPRVLVRGLVGLAGAEGAVVTLPTYCMCACPDGTAICVESIKGDCGPACAQAMQYCPSDM